MSTWDSEPIKAGDFVDAAYLNKALRTNVRDLRRPAFGFRNTSTVRTINSGATISLTDWDEVTYDTHGGYTTGVGYKVPRKGLWKITAHGGMSFASSPTTRYATVRVGSSSTPTIRSSYTFARGNAEYFTVTRTIFCDVNDAIIFQINNSSSGSAINYGYPSDEHPFMSGLSGHFVGFHSLEEAVV